MALGSTRSLTEMSTSNVFLGVKAAGVQGWPYHLHVLNFVMKSGSLNLPETLRACSDLYRDCFTLLYLSQGWAGVTRAQCNNVMLSLQIKCICYCCRGVCFFPLSAYSSIVCFARPSLVFGGSLCFGETHNLYRMFGWAKLSIVNFTADLPVLMNALHNAKERGIRTCSAVCKTSPLEIVWRDVTCTHYSTVFKLQVPAVSLKLR